MALNAALVRVIAAVANGEGKSSRSKPSTGTANPAAAAFARYIGIDYSGAETPTSSLKGLRVYMSVGADSPVEVLPPPSLKKYWTRRGIAEWLEKLLAEDTPTLVGIDHAFSFPLRYFEFHRLPPDWPILPSGPMNSRARTATETSTTPIRSRHGFRVRTGMANCSRPSRRFSHRRNRPSPKSRAGFSASTIRPPGRVIERRRLARRL